jgi:DNA modification methylase
LYDGVVMETTLLLGDCIDRLRELPDSSVHACVTDPPYGLSFMGKRWDVDVPGVEVWREVLRVLKPGGHLLAFFGTRTYHRGVVAVEDAGFEIRDQIGWAFGSGFPKSHDVSKAIDREAGAVREVVGTIKAPGMARINVEQGAQSRSVYEFEKLGNPATPEAQQWQGWGTALKPAWEPIVVARKPLDGTVAANVLEHGTGGINVDGCRVGTDVVTQHGRASSENRSMGGKNYYEPSGRQWTGRWPANLIHDGSDEVVGLFPVTTSGKWSGQQKGGDFWPGKQPKEYFWEGDSGSAARFFYCAKASKRDREEGLEDAERRQVFGTGGGSLDGISDTKGPRANHHPTVKPTDLMRYLCRLVTPPGGVVLDPFMGSGSTGKAAVLEGFSFIGIEHEAEYHAIAEARIRHAMPEPPQQVAAPAPLGQLTLW